MKKVKINTEKSKYAFSKSLQLLLVVLGVIGTLLGIFFSFSDFVPQLWIRIIVSLGSYILLLIISFVFYYFLNKVYIKHNKFKISISQGDILNEKNILKNDVLIFAVDTDYTMKLDNNHKISINSLQGQFINKFGSTVELLNNSYIKEIKYSVKQKSKYALLVPLTEIKEENNYIAEIKEDIILIFKETIKAIDGSNYKNILLPIIGSGETTPTKDYLSDRTNLICLWITLFKVYYRKNKELNLNFFVTNSNWYDLRFREI